LVFLLQFENQGDFLQQVTIIIPIIPTAQQRPRHSGRVVFKTTSQRTNEKEIIYYMRQQWKQPPIKSKVHLSVAAFFPIPASWPKYKKETAEAEEKTSKPDMSNLIKDIEDCGNGILWVDDAQITKFFDCGKYYSKDPCWIIRLKYWL
jgi:Holliday junction resolvase RusA-like endonuclease